MFSKKALLLKRTPENGTDRESFLSLLVDEFINSTSYDAKCQVLANLGNFAYDPINYIFIRNVGVLDIFLYCVKNEKDDKFLHYSCAGICNLCIDPLNTEYILANGGLESLANVLKTSSNKGILADIVLTLIYIYNHQMKCEINSLGITEIMERLKKSEDKYLSNLAIIFLQNYNSC